MKTSLNDADPHFQRGMSHVRAQDFESAVESFRHAAAAAPNHSITHSNLGASLAALGRHEDAVEAFRRAVEIDPDSAQAHFNLGASLQALGNSQDASACFVRTVEINPGHEEAYYFLGREHQSAGRLNEALACFLQAAEICPNEADIFTALAGVLVKLKLPGPAARALEKVLSLNPDDSMARANLIAQLARDCDWDKLETTLDWVPRLGVIGGPVPPFALLAFDDDPVRHLIRSQKFAETFPSIEPLPARPRPAKRPERLRIGYFSADFHDHATMFLAARLFELHDRNRFTIHAYSYGAEAGGSMRERALRAFDTFTDVSDLSNGEIAELSRRDGIDIAVDLKGYTEFQRVGIFAYRPAAIQMTYLGYPGTLAVPFIDYLIADRTVVPDEHRQAYSEQIIYLPHSYQANDDNRVLPKRGAKRSAAGLPQQGFVFCCFNYSYKISRAQFRIWIDLLKQVEGSVLWLLASPGNMEANLRQFMRSEDVDPSRLVIAPRTDLQSHFTRLQLADLFLDTFNYNAHTTASDALWAGVPVVTKAGNGFAGRVAASLLRAIGLPELITTNSHDYAELALSLAKDQGKLAAIRAKLETNRTSMPLFNSELFTRHIEAGFDLAYQRYVDGKAPEDIIVPSLE